MTQRYWVPYTPDTWSTFAADEWAGFLLEPLGVSGAGTLVGSAAEAAGAGNLSRSGAGSLTSLSGTMDGAGEVHFLRKQGSGALVADHGQIAGAARRDPGAVGNLAAGPGHAAGSGVRGVVGAGNLAAFPATTDSVVESLSGDGYLTAGAAAIQGVGMAITTIVGQGDLLAGEAYTVAAGDRDLVATPMIIERLYVPESLHVAVRSPASCSDISSSMAAGTMRGQCVSRAVHRARGEIELFYDDSERVLAVGGYCHV